jgi:hypothetical protein
MIDTTYQTLDEIEKSLQVDLQTAISTLDEIESGTYCRTDMDDELDSLFPDRDIKTAQASVILNIKQALNEIAEMRSK